MWLEAYLVLSHQFNSQKYSFGRRKQLNSTCTKMPEVESQGLIYQYSVVSPASSDRPSAKAEKHSGPGPEGTRVSNISYFI